MIANKNNVHSDSEVSFLLSPSLWTRIWKLERYWLEIMFEQEKWLLQRYVSILQHSGFACEVISQKIVSTHIVTVIISAISYKSRFRYKSRIASRRNSLSQAYLAPWRRVKRCYVLCYDATLFSAKCLFKCLWHEQYFNTNVVFEIWLGCDVHFVSGMILKERINNWPSLFYIFFYIQR